MPLECERLSLPGVLLFIPTVHRDERGHFFESYKCSDFSHFGVREQFLQDNQSDSIYATLRGLHFQKPPKAQAKLVRALHGEIFDVAVDIRKGSPSYGRWVGVRLSSENKKMLYLPVGFAHGFCVISERAEVLYKVSEEYSPQHEGGMLWNDPDLAIEWPIPTPVLSKKDTVYPRLKEIDSPFIFHKEIS